MKSFWAKLSFKITNKKIGKKNGEIQGGSKWPPLGLRVTIFSLGLLGLIKISKVYFFEIDIDTSPKKNFGFDSLLVSE